MSEGSFQSACAGKLPSFGDFVKYNASAREALAFDQWLQHGLYTAQTQLGRNWERTFLAAPAYDFLFWPENTERFLIGHIRPSHDRSHREYPFSVSLIVDRPRLGDSRVVLAPFLFSEFLAGARNLVERAMNGLELQEIVEATQALAVPLTVAADQEVGRHARFLEETSFREFCIRLFGDAAGAKRQVLFQHLIEILLPLRQWSMQRLKFGLRFPLPADGRLPAHEASYWLELCAKITGAAQFTPVAFWTSTEGSASRHLFLFFRQPSPKVFLQLLLPEEEQESVCILEKGEPGAVAAPAFTPRHQALLDDPAVSLKTILEKLP
jgi:type VI secretion system ImpM family protein